MSPRDFLLLVAALLPSSLAGQTPRCEHIQFRFVDSVYAPGASAVPARAPRIYRSSANGWSYVLSDTVVIDERAIAAVVVEPMRVGSDTAWLVGARTTPAGAQALADATTRHVGRYLGILIGTDLVNTPRIESPLVGTRVVLNVPAARAVADSIASVVRGAIDPGCRTPQSAPTTYFEFQVTKHVTIVPGNLPPKYPTPLRQANVSGEVLAQFVVDTLGRADMSTFQVLRSTDSLFTTAVEAAIPQYAFTPAELAGRKVRQLVQTPFQFNITPAPPPVALLPPDSIPQKLFAALGTVSEAPGMQRPYIRSIVAVSFHEGTSQADRQRAIDRVGGTVVGGIRTGANDGDYYVQIPDTTFAGILRAIDVLKTLPQVAVPHPLTADSSASGLQRAIKPR